MKSLFRKWRAARWQSRVATNLQSSDNHFIASLQDQLALTKEKLTNTELAYAELRTQYEQLSKRHSNQLHQSKSDTATIAGLQADLDAFDATRVGQATKGDTIRAQNVRIDELQSYIALLEKCGFGRLEALQDDREDRR